MVKRPLSKIEVQASKKGIVLRTKEIDEICQLQDIKELERTMILAKRKYNDVVLPLQRQQEDKSYNDELSQLASQLKLAKETILQLQSDINDGVEIKDIKSTPDSESKREYLG